MNYTRFSKEISRALRHALWEYELELDREGFVPLAQLLHSINEGGRYSREITVSDLEHIIDFSDKRRW